MYVPDRALSDRDPSPYRSFGYLVANRQEPLYDTAAWEEVKDEFEVCPMQRVYYIQYGPAPEDVCRWEDASCLAIATADRLRDVEADLRSRGK